MSKTLGLLSVISAMFQDFNQIEHYHIKPLSEDARRRLKEDIKRKCIEVNKKKGVKEFIIDGKKVYAINYKNALRKANLDKG